MHLGIGTVFDMRLLQSVSDRSELYGPFSVSTLDIIELSFCAHASWDHNYQHAFDDTLVR